MKKLQLPTCPYCNKKLDFIVALSIKEDGEYVCDNCKKTSSIKFRKKAYFFSWICELLAFFIMFVLIIFFKKSSLFDVFLVLLPFITFYCVVPYQMYLKKAYIINKKSRKNKFYNPINGFNNDIVANDRKRINTIERIYDDLK